MLKKIAAAATISSFFTIVACSPSVQKLNSEELAAANNAATKYFQSKSVIVNGQQIKGASGGCSSVDSNKDSYVSCSGTVPTPIKDPQSGKVIDVQNVDATIQCGVSKDASGCKQ